MSDRRVVHLVPTLESSGTLRQVVRVGGELVQAGYRVTVVSREMPASDAMVLALRRQGVEVEWPRAAPFLGTATSYVELDRVLQRLQPRLIHAWDDASIAAVAALSWRLPRTLVVCEYRTIEPRRARWRATLDRWIARRAAAVVVNSATVELDCRHRRLPPDKLVRIANGVASTMGDRTQVKRAIAAAFDLPATAHWIVACQPLLPRKRIKDLLWTIDLLHAVRDETYLLVVGDGPHRWRLERYARQVHADQRVRFLGARGDAPEIVAAADLLWSASPFESVPNSILEAMAARVPVITVDTPALREIIQPEVSGLLVPVGDRGRLARVTQGLLDDAARRVALTEAAAATVAARYSEAALRAAYRSLYDRLLTQ